MKSSIILLATAHEIHRNHDFSGYDIPLVDTRNAVGAGKRPAKYYKA